MCLFFLSYLHSIIHWQEPIIYLADCCCLKKHCSMSLPLCNCAHQSDQNNQWHHVHILNLSCTHLNRSVGLNMFELPLAWTDPSMSVNQKTSTRNRAHHLSSPLPRAGEVLRTLCWKLCCGASLCTIGRRRSGLQDGAIQVTTCSTASISGYANKYYISI